MEQAAIEIKRIHDEFRNEYEQIIGETLGSAMERIRTVLPPKRLSLLNLNKHY